MSNAVAATSSCYGGRDFKNVTVRIATADLILKPCIYEWNWTLKLVKYKGRTVNIPAHCFVSQQTLLQYSKSRKQHSSLAKSTERDMCIYICTFWGRMKKLRISSYHHFESFCWNCQIPWKAAQNVSCSTELHPWRSMYSSGHTLSIIIGTFLCVSYYEEKAENMIFFEWILKLVSNKKYGDLFSSWEIKSINVVLNKQT